MMKQLFPENPHLGPRGALSKFPFLYDLISYLFYVIVV